jgi:hypothetical protein
MPEQSNAEEALIKALLEGWQTLSAVTIFPRSSRIMIEKW